VVDGVGVAVTSPPPRDQKAERQAQDQSEAD
jgi:hypothetical protein